jgi:hypothetical protein
MKRMPRAWKMGAVGALALTSLTACVVGGYQGEGGVGYVGGFYEPGGYEYGGWGHDYRVGPPPRGGHEPRDRRAPPSIPHVGHGSNGHGGDGKRDDAKRH